MTPVEFFEEFMADDPAEGPDLPALHCVYTSDDVVWRKSVSSYQVWKYEGQYFKVTYSRSNSGYWSDGETYDPVVTEVFPYTFTETRYSEKNE